MRFKFIGLFAALLLLAACETAQQQSGTAGGTGGSTSSTSSGVGSTAQSGGSQQARRPAAEQLAAIGDRVYFDLDKYNLRTDAQAKAREWVAVLRDNPQMQVLLEGNCDERGTREYNLALGDRRANAARDFLVSQGIDARRIRTISYGKERPVALGGNEESWSRNRNVHIVVN